MANLVECKCIDCGVVRHRPPHRTALRCRACNNRLTNERKKGKTTWFVDDPCPDCGAMRRVAKPKIGSRCRPCDSRRKLAIYPNSPTKHGHCASGSMSPTFVSWRSAKMRCYQPDSPSFQHYGGRGIGMCDRWRESFDAFLADMGERPAGTTLERRDSRKNYEPGNCIWATPREQALNKRSTVWVDLDGEGVPLAVAAERLSISYAAARERSLKGILRRIPNPYAAEAA